jgi:hypothetical protein
MIYVAFMTCQSSFIYSKMVSKFLLKVKKVVEVDKVFHIYFLQFYRNLLGPRWLQMTITTPVQEWMLLDLFSMITTTALLRIIHQHQQHPLRIHHLTRAQKMKQEILKWKIWSARVKYSLSAQQHLLLRGYSQHYCCCLCCREHTVPTLQQTWHR